MSRPRSGLAAAADRWLFTPEAAGRVRMMRLLLAALIGVRLVTGPHRALAAEAGTLFRPVWFLSWMEEFPSSQTLVAIQVIGMVAAALAVLGWHERAAFRVSWLSLFSLAAMWASQGKIQHNDLPLLLVAGVLAAAPAGVRLRDRRRGAAWGWSVRTSLLVVAGIYFLTGFQKLVASGPAWVLSDNLRNVMYGARISGRAPTDQIALFIADRPALAHLVALGTIVVELGSLTTLVWARMRPCYLAAVIALHTAIYLTHGLDYSMWVGTAAIVLIDWHALFLEALDRRGARA